MFIHREIWQFTKFMEQIMSSESDGCSTIQESSRRIHNNSPPATILSYLIITKIVSQSI
jgi:hypothetical protein